MKIAIVHDWLMSQGGAEKVLKEILELYPAPVFTLFQAHSNSVNAKVNHSFLQKMPLAMTKYRNYLPFYPAAIEQFDLSAYDLILSSSHAVAKNVKTHENQLHICYCHTPMRYAWDLEGQYLETAGALKAAVARQVFKYLRKWDLNATSRVDCFVANSSYVAERIKRLYNRDASVIYPPVETSNFEVSSKKGDYYLTVSRMVPYKMVDLIVEAFNAMPEKKIKIVGDGPELEKLKKGAGKNIEFLGFLPNVSELMGSARGFVFAAEEDFGIAPVEAQAAGVAVVAFGKGGALETVVEGKTGLFFREQTAESLREAVEEFEKITWNGNLIRKHAEKFGVERFKREFKQFVDQQWGLFCENRNSCRR